MIVQPKSGVTPTIIKRSQVETSNFLTDVKEGTYSKKSTLKKLGAQVPGPRTISSALVHKKSKGNIDVISNVVPKRNFNIFDNNHRGAILSIINCLFYI